MILPAFLAFAAAVGLADLAGPGHQWSGLALLTGWFLSARLLPPRAWRGLLTAALALSVAIAVLAVVQMWWLPRARSPFASPNFLGAYSVLMFFIALAKPIGRQSWFASRKASVIRDSWPPTVMAGANLFSLALSQSRGAILALGAGLFVLLVRKRQTAAAFCILILGSIFAFVLIRPGVDEARWEIWRLGWQAAMLRPVTGWGQGGLVIGGLDRFYSVPLEVFIESGILGVAAGAWLLIAAWRAAAQSRNGIQLLVPQHAEGRIQGMWGGRTRNASPSSQSNALLAFLAAWFVQGLFLFSIPATNVLLVTVLSYLASEHRYVADRARGVDNDEPALNGRVRAGGAD
jgi:hypothetical protein